MKPEEIARIRMSSQQLLSTTFRSAPEMVAWFCAVQGQEYAQTKWGLGLRLQNLSDQNIEDDLSAGNIVRTHVLRPTWHFVNAADIKWLLKLSGPRVQAANAFMCRQLELDNKILNKSRDIIISLLQGNNHLTRNEINREFARKNIIAEGPRLSYIMMHAELEADICNGVRRGNQFTYGLLDERVPESISKTREESLAELARRYFLSRGPATVHDFSTWSGLTLADCNAAIALIRNILEKIESDSIAYYYSGTIMEKSGFNSKIFFLPPYDEYIMGYKDRNAIMQFRNNFAEGLMVNYTCMIIRDGQIIGSWKRTPEKKRILLEYDLLKPDHEYQDELNTTISRFSEFNGLPVVNVKI